MSTKETNTLLQCLEQMSVNTPVSKSLAHSALRSNLLSSEDYSSTPLSPPSTVETRQKRERSESLVMHNLKETTAVTKRRLRSRSRIIDDPMKHTPSCSSKPNERTFPDEGTSSKHFNTHVSSVFMTPCSEERQPLQCRDLNCSIFPPREKYDYSSPSDSDDDELKTRLRFDHEEESRDYGTPVTAKRIWEGSKIIGPRMGEKKVDFIQELINLNCEEICKKIFCYLEPKNLQRVASVSKLWRRVCKKDRMASPRLDQFVHGRKQYVIEKGKENLGYCVRYEHKVPSRTPLSAKNNTLWTPEQEKTLSEKAALEQIKTDLLSTYERVKCPACGSPSRKVGDEVSQCDKCQGMFCQQCQHRIDEHHKTGKCAIKVKHSKKGKRKEVIGTKQSKNRLKRF